MITSIRRLLGIHLPILVLFICAPIMAQTVEENSERIAANADAIGYNASAIASNASAISDNRNMIGELSEDLDFVYDVIDIIVAGPSTRPYQIPPAFLVDGGLFEVIWICDSSAGSTCDISIVGDGGNPQVLTGGFGPSTLVNGSWANTLANRFTLSIAALDPESYWLGGAEDDDWPPVHVWLVHERGWVHVFDSVGSRSDWDIFE